MAAIDNITVKIDVLTKCKDCKHLQTIKGVDWCMKLVRHTEPDFFCGFGEEVKDATAQDTFRS